uniref:Mitochondrial inner membrane protease subunit n=1 Tax=Strigamia maritima TaxID=126957 RepID=T1JDW9_STRMM
MAANVFKSFNNFAVKAGAVLVYMVQYGCIAHCGLEFLGDFVVCSGPSMEPTIYSRDILLTEHITTIFQKVNRGDVIVARSPSNPHHFICKRVIGVPGDRIQSHLTTSYVPRGHVWLEGDNKTNSTDSRVYGAVPVALIRGKAMFKV